MKFFVWPVRKYHLLLSLALLTFSLSACGFFTTPLNPEGPPNFGSGSPAGYWLWYDNDGWHLRTTTALNPSRFTGTISVDEGQITDIKLYNTDKKESAQLEKPNLLRLDFYTQGSVRGVDFKATAECLTCNLKVDDKYYRKLIVIGKAEETPSSVPFVVCLPPKTKIPPAKETKPVKPVTKEEPAKPVKQAETPPATKEQPAKPEEPAKKEEPVKKEEPPKKEEPQVKTPAAGESSPQVIITEGRPGFGPASKAKYWIWHDDSGWHLRTTTAGKVREFLGQIQALEGTLENITPTRKDPEFKINRSPSGFEFIYKSVGAIEGLDWQSKSPCLEFHLALDGKSDPKTVSVGMMAQEPAAVPFALCQQKAVAPLRGKPKVGPEAMGILLWQDSDGWHLRNTVNSAHHKVEGTVTHPGGGRGEVTATPAIRSKLTLSGEESFSFNFKADRKEEGFDWKPKNLCAVFDLKFDGERRPQLIIIGSEAKSPMVVPFGLCQ